MIIANLVYCQKTVSACLESENLILVFLYVPPI